MPKLSRSQIIAAKKQMRDSGFLKCYEDVRPITDLQYAYDEMNAELFGNELPDIPVEWNPRLRRCFAKAKCTSLGKGKRRGTRKNVRAIGIEVSANHAFTPRQLRKTLVHEMCHVWCFVKWGEVGHGPMFWKKMAEVKYPKGHVFHNQLDSERDVYSDY